MNTCDGNHTWGKCDRDSCDFERLIGESDYEAIGIDLGPETELDLSSCPYYQGTGTCERGCYSEPSCITNEPLEGWPSRRDATTPKAG